MSENTEERRKKMEVMKLELQIAKSTAAKMELEFKIVEAEDSIVRMREHQAMQEKTIADSRAEIAKLKGGA